MITSSEGWFFCGLNMKNIISEAKIKEIAGLANIKVTEEQADNLAESVSSVVGYMEEIKNLDLDAIPETARVTEEVNVLREDVVKPSFTQEDALKNGKSHKGYFIVPYVFENKEE